MKKKSKKSSDSVLQARLDNLKDNIARPVKTSKVLPQHDKRTISSTKKAAAQIAEQFKAGEIAKELGISPQKWTAIKKQIKAGKAYSPELRDIITEAGNNLSSGLPFSEPVSGTRHLKIKGKEKVQGTAWFITEQWADNNIKYHQIVTPGGGSRKSAINWFIGVTGGSDYFAIMSRRMESGNLRYFVVDIRNHHEKNMKGELEGITKALTKIDPSLEDEEE